jgi:alkylation response protein AidB-like acyl-CoA dehydrogenase
MTFLLQDVFQAEKVLTGLPGYEEVSEDLVSSILEEAGKFCAGVLRPINQSGDEEGSRLEGGLVFTPKGFKEAFKAFVDGGWSSLSAPTEFEARACRARCRSWWTRCSRLPTCRSACFRA